MTEVLAKQMICDVTKALNLNMLEAEVVLEGMVYDQVLGSRS